MNEKLRYRAGLRKRTLTGILKEVSEAGGVKCFKIQKRTKLSWINEKDVVNVETKTETGQGSLDQNEGRDKTASEQLFEANSQLQARLERYREKTHTLSLKSPSQATEGIQRSAPEMASGETLPVLGGQISGEADMFPGIASSARGSSRRRSDSLPAKPDGIVGRVVCSCASVGDGASEGSEKSRIDSEQLERDEAEFWKRQPAELANWKKRVCRAARNGISLREFAPNIAARAIVNDVGFFKRLAKALEARKKQPKIKCN